MNGTGSQLILQGDVRTALNALADESVQCIVTSPPYWGLRDYGAAGQIGSESTPDEFVQTMVEVFRGLRRVLRRDGTMWLNLGDTYTSGGRTQYDPSAGARPGEQGRRNHPTNGKGRPDTPPGLKPKDLCGIPWRVALALQADGWWLRSDVIWAKPNPMPESATDRPNQSHEYIFLLTKSARYFYDVEAVREQARRGYGSAVDGKPMTGRSALSSRLWRQCEDKTHTVERGPRESGTQDHPETGRNCRSVWTIATQPYRDAHFATFPEALARRCIQAGTSEKGACPYCRAPLLRITERTQLTRPRPNDQTERHQAGDAVNSCGNTVAGVDVRTIGWRATCSCDFDLDSGGVPCIVLDPFMGSGTTLGVAGQLGHHGIGIELNPEYIDQARARIGKMVRPETSNTGGNGHDPDAAPLFAMAEP